MSTVVPKKAATKKVATKSSSKLKISFHLKYKTHFGQVIYLYGNHPQLGNQKIEQAIPMVYLNDDYWVLHVSIDTIPNEKITYHYFILNEDGTRVFDAGIGQSIHPGLMQKNEMVIIDSWNFTGFKENAFYTAPFDKVLLPKRLKEVKSGLVDTKSTHVFRVKAPLLDADQTILHIGRICNYWCLGWCKSKTFI
jgi:4-alpha-glucanotransferase